MSSPLVAAARGLATEQTPVWVMRQAGRYLPEYRELRKRVPFQKAVATPEVAAEITLQPIERFAMDGAVIFADIMTPLEAMGVDIEFDPGPKLRPHTLREVVDLPELKTDRVSFVAETIRLVRQAVPAGIAVIGFAGAPLTLLAYLVEGGGSKDYMTLRAGLRREPDTAAAALHHLARSMGAYLAMQVDAGADVVQLFDSWAGIVDRLTYADLIAPAASAVLSSQRVPSIYFAPHSPHTLDLQAAVGANVFGVDWRLPLDQAWDRIGAGAIQGNLDPAVLLSDPDKIATAVEDVMSRARGRSGHIFNLGHGIHADTPPENLAAMVDAVRG